jgi:hypothetical protein
MITSLYSLGDYKVMFIYIYKKYDYKIIKELKYIISCDLTLVLL